MKRNLVLAAALAAVTSHAALGASEGGATPGRKCNRKPMHIRPGRSQC